MKITENTPQKFVFEEGKLGWFIELSSFLLVPIILTAIMITSKNLPYKSYISAIFILLFLARFFTFPRLIIEIDKNKLQVIKQYIHKTKRQEIQLNKIESLVSITSGWGKHNRVIIKKVFQNQKDEIASVRNYLFLRASKIKEILVQANRFIKS